MNCTLDSYGPEQIAVGSLYIIIFFAFVTFYLPTLIFLWKDEQLMTIPIYTVLVWNCLCDLFQLVGLAFAGGVYTLLNNTCNRQVNRFWGFVINFPWETGNMLELILAFDRFLSVTSRYWSEKLFSQRKTKIWVASAFIYGLAINGIYMLVRDGGVMYDLQNYAWAYTDYPGSDEDFVTTMEIVIDFVTEPLMLVFCIGIAIKMVFQRSGSSSHQLSKKERNAIYQVFIICTSLLVMNLILLVLPLMFDSRWIPMIGNLLWIIVCGWFPLIVLSFNLTLRNKVQMAVGWKKTTERQKTTEVVSARWAVATNHNDTPLRHM